MRRTRALGWLPLSVVCPHLCPRSADNCYRIPSMTWVASTSSAQGALLAFAEGRRPGCDDHGDVRIVMRHSEDGGATWSAIKQVQVETGHTIGNPAPVADLTVPGGVHLIFARDNTQIFVTSSTDGGASWSSRRNMTDVLKPSQDPTAFVASGPPGGVQLPSGRLVAGLYGADATGQVRPRGWSHSVWATCRVAHSTPSLQQPHAPPLLPLFSSRMRPP